MTQIEVPVLIAGGGPVGMTLALNLARYGIRSLLLERNPATTRHPKMDLTNGRSMELFHRLGLDEALRDAGVPRANGFDILWITSMVGHDLYRFPYPPPTRRPASSARRTTAATARRRPCGSARSRSSRC
ncbi:FAD-dependent monooxygenase [Novosphingobium resinovorum]